MSHWRRASNGLGRYIETEFKLNKIRVRRLTKCEQCDRMERREGALYCTSEQTREPVTTPSMPWLGCSDYCPVSEPLPGPWVVAVRGRVRECTARELVAYLEGLCVAFNYDLPTEEDMEWLGD